MKFYVNVGNGSTYGIDGFGAYFGDNSLDTISVHYIPLTYLIPQVQNSIINIISDTLNWILVNGTFVATGNEKNMVIGNFKDDASTNKILINPTNLPTAFTDCGIDDVSCIPIDLPAYAHSGPDIWAIPGTTTYIGRQQDVGIDEACEWFKLPNSTNVIANVAGLTLTVAATTETYMVKQDICGVIKYDTVVIHASALGVENQKLLSQNLKVYPQPSADILNVECWMLNDESIKIKLFNNLGQIIRDEELFFRDGKGSLKINGLDEGVYMLTLQTKNNIQLNSKIVIAR